MRLIDADALKKTLNEEAAFRILKVGNTKAAEARGLITAVKLLEAAPTIDAVPVVHGKMLPVDPNSDVYFYCTNCMHDIDPPLDSGDCAVELNYCPNCGAKMDGKDGE